MKVLPGEIKNKVVCECFIDKSVSQSTEAVFLLGNRLNSFAGKQSTAFKIINDLSKSILT